MYTSLDRIDIVMKDKETGRHGFVLTDHRTAVEIESEPELSVLFALTRVSGAKTYGEQEGGADVRYMCMHEPPRFLQEAVCSAGGTVHHELNLLPPVQGARSISDIADEAFVGLAARIAQRERRGLDEGLLAQLEDVILAAPPDQEEEEPEFWTKMFEVAAVCGELLRAKLEGRWNESREANGIFPFAFQVGERTFNVADKSRRFMERGESQRPSQLLLMADDLDLGADGPMMVNLKPGDTPREMGVCRDILEGGQTAEMPLVFLGRDQPNSFAYLPADSENAEDSFREALSNLAALELEAVPHDIAGIQVLVVSDNFYAGEKILDEGFMAGLQRKLGVDLLAASMPYKGLLLVTQEVAPPGVAGFLAATKALHADSRGAPPLSPVVFLVKDGKVVGHLATESQKPDVGGGKPQEKKGLLSRLFGKVH